MTAGVGLILFLCLLDIGSESFPQQARHRAIFSDCKPFEPGVLVPGEPALDSDPPIAAGGVPVVVLFLIHA